VSKTIDQKESVDRSEFRELISECVGKYNPNIDIKEYLLSILQKYNVCADDYERNRTIREIHLVIDGIATEYQKLLTFKNKGNSRIDWLINKADELSNIPEEKNSIVNGLNQYFDDANEVLIHERQTLECDDEVSKILSWNKIEKDLRTNVLQQIFQYSDNDSTISSDHIPNANNDYFNSELNSDKIKNLKKIVATSLFAAQQNKKINNWINKTPVELSTIVDRGITVAKVAYDVGTGNNSAKEAIEVLVDHAAATVAYYLESTAPFYIEKAGAFIGGAAVGYFSPANAVYGAQIGGYVGRITGQHVGTYLSKGIMKLADFAKSIVKSPAKLKNLVKIPFFTN